MIDNNTFKQVNNSILTDPDFLQLVYGFTNSAYFYLRPEHPDELFDKLKKRFEDYCANHRDLEGYDVCKGCPLENTRDCRIAWMNMPYNKKEDK